MVCSLSYKHHKQFNSDSQRLALSLQVEFGVYSAVFGFSACDAHTLIGRYKRFSVISEGSNLVHE